MSSLDELLAVVEDVVRETMDGLRQDADETPPEVWGLVEKAVRLGATNAVNTLARRKT